MAKRPLTSEEQTAAARLQLAISASRMTQEAIGSEVGVSQGMIWQWANARQPVPVDRALALALALGAQDPGVFCPAWYAATQGADVMEGDEIALLHAYRAASPERKSAILGAAGASDTWNREAELELRPHPSLVAQARRTSTTPGTKKMTPAADPAEPERKRAKR